MTSHLTETDVRDFFASRIYSTEFELHTQTLAHFLGLSSGLEADERSIDRRSLCSFENDDDV